MCIITAKHFPKVGWVGCKNRDRNYKPQINIRQSFRGGIERLFIWDTRTRYTEGLNEYGVSILLTSVTCKKDENEVDLTVKKNKKKALIQANSYFAPDGVRIRKALLEKTIDKAVDRLIELELPGNILVFDENRLILMEGAFKKGGRENYVHKEEEIEQGKTPVRTNHGIWFPFAGYEKDSEDEHVKNARKSSETRFKKVSDNIKKIDDPDNILDAISDISNKENLQMNPLRYSKTHGKSILVTTGQIAIYPSKRTLVYRPVWSDIEFDLIKLNSGKTKTFFELKNPIELNLKESNNNKIKFSDFYFSIER